MEIEIIPNTNLYEKDCKKFKIVRKDNGETYYYVTLKNNGGRCLNTPSEALDYINSLINE